MKKLVSILVLLSMVLALCSTAMASSKIHVYDYVKFTGNAYGYEKAGSKKTDLIIKKGSCAYVYAVSSNGKWVKISVDWYADTNGDLEYMWFSTDHLKVLGDDDTYMPLIFASGGSGRSYQIDKAHTFAPKGASRVKATGKVNIRKTASLSGKSLGVLHKGESLKYLKKVSLDSRGLVFFKVRYNGKNAWVSSIYTKLGKYTKLTADWYVEQFYGL